MTPDELENRLEQIERRQSACIVAIGIGQAALMASAAHAGVYDREEAEAKTRKLIDEWRMFMTEAEVMTFARAVDLMLGVDATPPSPYNVTTGDSNG